MSKEINNTIQPEILEKMIISRYAAQVGISFDELDDSMELDPHKTFADVFFENWKDQVYHDTIVGFYQEMPADNLGDEALDLMDDIHLRTRDFLKRPEILNDVEGANILRGMNIYSISEFSALMHGKVLGSAEKELRAGKLTENSVVRLVFWSKMHKIGAKGVELLSINDPDLVLKGSQPDSF